MEKIKVVLISTYELGRQPFALASPAAWLQEAGAIVHKVDLSIEELPTTQLEEADLVAFSVPMHTATRLAANLIPTLQELNPKAHLCFYGLYAPMNEDYLRSLGVQTLIGGEFETGLVQLYQELLEIKQNQSINQKETSEQSFPLILKQRQQFILPDRSGLPDFSEYAQLCFVGENRQKKVGFVEATRGCKHLCRHCPVVPVYQGRFFVVQKEVVLADIRQQVKAGAEHITFGDPDFFNGIGHSLSIIQALHQEFPHLTYDVTIKVQHLHREQKHLPTLKKTGCIMITCAVESMEENILVYFDKQHTKEEFIRVVQLCKSLELSLNPTFVTFTPWTTLANYRDLLTALYELDLVDQVSPIQLAIRLLIPRGSKLLELPDIQSLIENFDEEKLSYTWTDPDPQVEELYQKVLSLINEGNRKEDSRRVIFLSIWNAVQELGNSPIEFPPNWETEIPQRATIPFLNEPWYC